MRLDVTVAELQEQFDFGMRIHRPLNDATSAIASIRAIRREADDRIRQLVE